MHCGVQETREVEAAQVVLRSVHLRRLVAGGGGRDDRVVARFVLGAFDGELDAEAAEARARPHARLLLRRTAEHIHHSHRIHTHTHTPSRNRS